jgi:hypothetical protein
LNKKVLIISPFFPPTNAADMQRVRTSLIYFEGFGWDTEVVCVDEHDTDMVQDPLLLESIPPSITIHKVRAFRKSLTSKLGLGSLALRSIWHYQRKVDRILSENRFDLVYFSTTQFPLCVLGTYWKKKFSIPFIIDMQDPWHSEYYQNKPRAQRPKKYWFSYRLNKFLEPLAIRHAGGLISVSESYITTLIKRYPVIRDIPAETISFGAYPADMQTARTHAGQFKRLLDPGYQNIVYIGRGGEDMGRAITAFFEGFKAFRRTDPELASRVRMYFIGTSYAPSGSGIPTVIPLAVRFGIADQVVETTDRISYFHTLSTLLQASALFVPGSDDPAYTASKLYPYLLTEKPLLALFHSASPALATLKEYGVHDAHSYDQTEGLDLKIGNFLRGVSTGKLIKSNYADKAKEKYSAKNTTRLQCLLFEKVLKC